MTAAAKAAYLVAVGVGGGPVAQFSSRPVGSSPASAHPGVATGRGSKVGLAACTHQTHTCSTHAQSVADDQGTAPAPVVP